QKMHAIKDESHPLIYVARGSHASYPKPGTHARVLGLFNDINHPSTNTWQPNVSSRYTLLQQKPGFKYRYDRVDTYQAYLDKEENLPQYSTTSFMRTIGILSSPTSLYEKVKNKLMKYDHRTIESNPLAECSLK